MRRILLDQSAPLGLRRFLTGYDVKTAYEMGWDRLANGKLLAAAEEAGFSIMVSADQNIWHQIHHTGRKITLVVIGSNHWETVRQHAQAVVQVCDSARQGSYIAIPLPKAPRRRRSYSRAEC